MVVNFINVGRNNVSFKKECKSKLTKEWLIKQVKPYILSSCIEFFKTEDGKINIMVGTVRKMGEIEVEDI